MNLNRGYFNKPDSEVDYFYSENGIEITFLTALQNRKRTQLCAKRSVVGGLRLSLEDKEIIKN